MNKINQVLCKNFSKPLNFQKMKKKRRRKIQISNLTKIRTNFFINQHVQLKQLKNCTYRKKFLKIEIYQHSLSIKVQLMDGQLKIFTKSQMGSEQR